MTKVLRFPSRTDWEGGSVKTDIGLNLRRRLDAPLSVIQALLPSGEKLPLIVDQDTGLPLSLAMRWAVFSRRHACAESTLRADMYALRYVYAWGDRRFEGGLELRLESAGPLSNDDLFDLRQFLEAPHAAIMGQRPHAVAEGSGSTAAVAGRRALAAKLFLKWASDPANRNQRGAAPSDALDIERRIDAALKPLTKYAGRGGVGSPIDEKVAARIDEWLTPLTDAQGRFLRPLRWHQCNPFRPDTRLRNWLMWSIARDTGVRIGELLSLHVGDFPMIRGQKCVSVLRRPDSIDEVRANPPQAKTVERAIPLGAHSVFALQAYMVERPPVGRRKGSPFLITSREGRPLSQSSANSVVKQLCEASFSEFSWHSLRHAWATDIARAALSEALRSTAPGTDPDALKALLIEELRALGGWSPTSNEPMRYARIAIKEYADDRLRARQDARAERILKHRGTHTSEVG